MNIKQCDRCKQWKNQKEFTSFNSPGVIFTWCFKCRNKDRIRENQKRLYHIPKHRISRNIRTGIYKSLHTGKGGSWEKAVGYTFLKLKAHLEKQFIDGMSWDNHGEWQIDHIEPISSFSFQGIKDSDFKRYWALSNLQPLWAKDNWHKHK